MSFHFFSIFGNSFKKGIAGSSSTPISISNGFNIYKSLIKFLDNYIKKREIKKKEKKRFSKNLLINLLLIDYISFLLQIF
ncbi:MAG: hypothetical protein DSY40_02185 [Nautilia sp.]|nr:MAG: hypothetical protein DSY40_02185 [Nautilia sp.]